MKTKISGIITTIYRDDINTDDIIPSWTLQESDQRSYFAQHAFEKFDHEFIARCQKEPANIVIAGNNFGCGSSREQAVYALQNNNVVAVIAQSYPDIFYRNSVNNGLILIIVPDSKVFKLAQEVGINLDTKELTYGKQTIKFSMPDEDARMFKMGGAIGRVKSHLTEQKAAKGRGYKHFTKAKIKYSKPHTIAEKIIAAHVGYEVFLEQRIEKLPIDILFFNEVIGPPAITMFKDDFGHDARVFDAKSTFFIPDHTVPSSSVKVSEGIALMEEFSKEQGAKCYKEGDGIEHVVLIEDGVIVPGEIILGTDSHTDTNGALNTMAFGVGTTDSYFAMATGALYDFIVPQTIRINLTGKLKKGVASKDLILHIIGMLGVAGASKSVVEFGGSGLANIPLDGRTTIANMVVEMGARTAIFESDVIIEDYIKERKHFPYKVFAPDAGAVYKQEINVDVSQLEPQIAFPHKPDNVAGVSKIKEYMKASQNNTSPTIAKIDNVKITDAFLGACTNGKYDDFIIAAKVMKGHKVHPDVNFVVIPASRKIYNRLMNEGILQIFAEAGANIESSNCGPCFGKHMGVIGAGSHMISTSNRNYIGRMGSEAGQIFLASPATVTASAIRGEITDPRKFLK